VLKRQTIFKYKQTEHIQNEKMILQNLNYPAIVKLYSSFNDPFNLYLLMEYVPGGELFTYMRKFGQLSEHVTKFIVAEIVIVLDFLHAMNIIYRDLKPENILLDARGHIKLTDFGFAKIVTDKTWTTCGTPDYLAPEIISGTGHYKFVDWWSLGILIYEMLLGYPPFRDEITFHLFEKICDPTMLIIPDSVGGVARDLISKLLVVEPTRRLGSGYRGVLEITEHPWFATLDWAAIAKRETNGPITPTVSSPHDTSNYTCRPIIQPSYEGVVVPPEINAFFDTF